MKNKEFSPKKILVLSRCAWTLYNFRKNLILNLMEKGHRVISAGAGGDGFEEPLKDSGISFYGLPIDKRGINPVSDIKLFFFLYKWIKKEKPDVILNFTIKPVIYASIAAKLARVPKIINIIPGLGFVFGEESRSWLKTIVSLMYKTANASSDFTFFQNKDDRDFFIHSGLVKEEKSGLLPGSGVDCEYFCPKEFETDKKTSPEIVMIARLLKDKGVYEFAKAAEITKKSYHDAGFVLIGPRDERNPLVVPEKDIEAWEKAGILKWTGPVKDVRPFLQKADIVVLPSFYREGTPRALLEAAAMEKPIITTDSVGCREAVDDNITGILIPPKNPRALSEAICLMLENPKKAKEMGLEGRKKMQTCFDEKIVIAKIMEKI